MKKALKWLAGVLALAVLIAGAYFLYHRLGPQYAPDRLAGQSQPDTNQSQPEPLTAPDFTVLDNEGTRVALSSLFGKPIVVNFWASWCPPCKAEMPDFEQMYLKYGDKVHFMVVNMTDGQRETLETAKAHIRSNNFTFPTYFDTEFSAAYAYFVSSLPATYFINAQGELVTYANAMIDAATLEKGIRMILPQE